MTRERRWRSAGPVWPELSSPPAAGMEIRSLGGPSPANPGRRARPEADALGAGAFRVGRGRSRTRRRRPVRRRVRPTRLCVIPPDHDPGGLGEIGEVPRGHASIRPRRLAAERPSDGGGERPVPHASIRPRRLAAERLGPHGESGRSTEARLGFRRHTGRRRGRSHRNAGGARCAAGVLGPLGGADRSAEEGRSPPQARLGGKGIAAVTTIWRRSRGCGRLRRQLGPRSRRSC
jgi:hypothetical protein